ncbi:hypothetical protein [Halospeciosus flavus]|uniref:Uncharacterized protein n=1 Tax=Halospeciosus flavus TaxID=3032283 RepID=A0ABD5YZQ6_9EURY
MVDRSTSLDQFQTDADETDELDYIDANFSSGATGMTSAKAIVRDEKILEKETHVTILEYERALQTNETVNETLVENDSTRSVANLVATTSIREDRAAELQTRERELARTETSLAEALDSLESNPNDSVRARTRVDVQCDRVVRHRVQPAVHRCPRPTDRALHRLRAPRRDALPGGSSRARRRPVAR